MPRLSEHERSGAIGMLQPRVRVSDVARYYNCHSSNLQHLKDSYQATGTVKDRCRFGQARMTNRRQVDCIDGICIDGICIYDIRSERLLKVPDE